MDLVVGVGLIAALAVLGAPGVAALREASTLRGVPQELYGELQRARSAAIMENNRYHFTLQQNGKSFRIHDNEDNDEPPVVDPGERAIVQDVLSHSTGVTISASGVITFYPNGSASGGTLTVTGPGGEANVVQVSSGGRIRIQ